MEEKEEGRSSTAKHESAVTTITTTSISTTPSSPSHEFSFTISLRPSFADDLSPADQIFFHGHLLPLHLLAHLPISPRSSLECNSGTVPCKDSSKDHEPKETNNKSAKLKSKVKSFSLLFRPAKWRKQCESKEEVDQETSNTKVKFDAGRILKKYLRMPFLFFKDNKKKNGQMHRQQQTTHSVSSDIILERKQEMIRGVGFTRRELSLSAPASVKTSQKNTDSSLKTVKNITSSISDCNTMEDLQNAIEAAIAHCKNSVPTK